MLKLIDADAYLKKVCTYNETGCGSCRFQTKCPADEPTIDAIPVEWLEKKRSAMYPGSEKELIVRRLIDDWGEENVS